MSDLNVAGGLEVRRCLGGDIGRADFPQRLEWGVVAPAVDGLFAAWWPVRRKREALALRGVLLGMAPGGDFGALRPGIESSGLLGGYRRVQRLVRTVDSRLLCGECPSCGHSHDPARRPGQRERRCFCGGDQYGCVHGADFSCGPDVARLGVWFAPEELRWLGEAAPGA